jgi:tetratricopeptide (TPR) repeat protein
MRVKLVEVYEEFAERYPNDHELPEIYYRLGKLYREFGAFQRAQDRYYKVLSTTIRGVRTEDEKKEFRQTSLNAQIEVADLFLELGNYERAAQFFDRLLRLDDLDPDGSTNNRARVEFKRAYATYYSVKDLKGDDLIARNEGFAKVINYLLNSGSEGVPYYDAYPHNIHAPESHFLLASIYRLLGTKETKDKANEEVLKLLEKANKGVRAKTVTVKDFDEKATIYQWSDLDKTWQDNQGEPASVDALMEIRDQIDLWVHWQKKAGNFLANELFEEGGLESTRKAVEIYQKMILLDSTPKWQAPIVYQLGLCFERIGGNSYNPKAIEAYEIITNNDKNPASWNNWTDQVKRNLGNTNQEIDDNLSEVLQGQDQFIYRMAEWRLKNLRWNLTAQGEIKRLEN